MRHQVRWRVVGRVLSWSPERDAGNVTTRGLREFADQRVRQRGVGRRHVCLEPALLSLVKLASIPLQQSPPVHSQPRLIGIVHQCQRLDWLDPLLFGTYKMRHYEVECYLHNLT